MTPDKQTLPKGPPPTASRLPAPDNVRATSGPQVPVAPPTPRPDAASPAPGTPASPVSANNPRVIPAAPALRGPQVSVAAIEQQGPNAGQMPLIAGATQPNNGASFGGPTAVGNPGFRPKVDPVIAEGSGIPAATPTPAGAPVAPANVPPPAGSPPQIGVPAPPETGLRLKPVGE